MQATRYGELSRCRRWEWGRECTGFGLVVVGVVCFSSLVVGRPVESGDADVNRCVPELIGDGECQFSCNTKAFQFDKGDCTRHRGTAEANCDSQLGLGFLESLNNTRRELCESVVPGRSSVQLYSVPDNRCGSQRADVAVFRNVRVSYEPDTKRYKLSVACGGDVGSELDNWHGSTAVNEGRIALDARPDSIDEATCTTWEEEPTMFVIDPRREYLDNMYHASEEIFSLYETAYVISPTTPLSFMRLVFASSSSGDLIQMPSQVNGNVKTHANGIMSRHQIVEMFSRMVARPREQRMALLSIPPQKGTCFRKLMMPMRACHGSIGVASWERAETCPHGNAIAEAVSHEVRHSFHLDAPVPLQSTQITIMTREKATKRVLRNAQAVKSAIESALPGVKVETVSLDALTFAAQMQLMWRTAVLVGPHGAGMSLLLFLPRNAGVVESTSHPPPFGSSRSVAHIFWQYAKWTNHPYKHVSNAENPSPDQMAVATKELYENFKSKLKR